MKQDNLNLDIPDFVPKYLEFGLTYKSDDTNIINRDAAGNISLVEDSELNQLLIIEPIVKRFNTNSLLRVYNTSFQYYTFPVTVTSTSTTDLNLDINLENIALDPIYARYKPATDFTISPSNGTYSGILMDEVADGLIQLNGNNYTISKEMKNSGKDLFFRIKIAHSYSNNTIGNIYWSLIKAGPNYTLNREWREPFASSRLAATTNFNALILDIATTMRDLCDDPAKFGGEYNTINYEEPWITYYRYFKSPDMVNPGITADQTRLTGNQLEAINYVLTRDAKKVPRTGEDTYTRLISELNAKLNSYNTAVSSADDTWGVIDPGTVQNVYINEIVRNSDFEIGDIFSIGAKTDNDGHTVLNEQSYWVITDASKNVDEWNQEIA